MRLAIFLMYCLMAVSLVHGAADAETLHRNGIELLRKAVAGDDAAVVPAAEFFAKASALYEANGNQEGAQLSNACLYWSKKRMNFKQAEVFAGHVAGNLDAQKTVKAVDMKVEKDQASAYFDRADAFAKAHPDEILPIAIRYFEVADRFVGNPISIKAQELSLSAMQKIKLSAFGAPKAVTDEDALKIPAVAKAGAAFESTIIKTKEKYSKELISAHKSAQTAGNLEVMKQIEGEEQFLESDAATPPTLLTGPVGAMQERYIHEIYAARKEFIRVLDDVRVEETKKGNTALASRLLEVADRERVMADIVGFAGEWTSAKYGPWAVSVVNGKVTLSELGAGYHSSDSVKVANSFVFKWDAANAIVLERKSDGLYVICYEKYYLNRNLVAEKPTGKTFFDMKLERKK